MTNTTLCYVEKDGRYLMLYRNKKPHDPNAGKWVGIGGHMEEGESPEDCLKREAYEETGLVLEQMEPRGLVTFVSDRYETEYMHLFTCHAFSGTLHPCQEGTLQWIPITDVPQLPLWEGDKLFLSFLALKHPYFSLKLCYQGDSLQQAFLNGQPLPL
ncbi:MAG TPA: 8-oxo-dGTP diphosphatase [Firmicutes bacterium]|nr:8-oxo-dGTP diphosphatase [Bacillota bacterium]